MCRTAIFCLSTACDALLLGQGGSPSWVRGMCKLGQVLPEERQRILEIEGASHMRPQDVAATLPLFVESAHPQPGSVMEAVQREVEWMIDNGLHREALHALWAGFALGQRGRAGSDDPEIQKQAVALAHTWLAAVGWQGNALKAKERALGALVERIRQRVADIKRS